MQKISEYTDPENWVHHKPYILPQVSSSIIMDSTAWNGIISTPIIQYLVVFYLVGPNSNCFVFDARAYRSQNLLTPRSTHIHTHSLPPSYTHIHTQGRTVWWNPVQKAADEFEDEEGDEDEEKEQPEQLKPESGPSLLSSISTNER